LSQEGLENVVEIISKFFKEIKMIETLMVENEDDMK